MSKHRKVKSRSKKFAAVTATTATAAALTAGAAATPDKTVTWGDIMLTAGPNYTQLITDLSNSYDNLMLAGYNFNSAGASFWNPLASASGGLLPTFSTDYDHNDLATIPGILAALADALNDGTDLSVIPGLPADATTTVAGGLLAGLLPIPGLGTALGGVVTPVLGSLGAIALLSGVLDTLAAIPLLDGVPTLTDLLGLTATQTTYENGFSWPILGSSGETTFGNTFVNLPSLTGLVLVENILDSLDFAGIPVSNLPAVNALVAATLSPLNGISTPSVTAWIPAASGNYTLPLGGSLGWLAAMPTAAVGPIAVGPLILSDSETVLMIPISAMGAQLPGGLANFGYANASVLFPTATGVSQLGGTTLQTFSIPLLGLGYSSLNLAQASYVGTNGFNYNSGTTVGTLITPFGPVPLVYSMGSFNAGTTGFGFTGPSFLTVGLLPPIQIGTAPTNQSDDGLIPKEVLNLGLVTPTQTTNVWEAVGLPNPQAGVNATINPLFNATAAPIGAQLTNYLNDNLGDWVNRAASQFEDLTGQLADASGGLPGAPTTMLASSAAPSSAKVTNSGTSSTSAADLTNLSANLNDSVKKANTSFATAAKNARAQSDATVKRAQATINKIAADGQKAIKDTVNGVKKAVDDTAKKVNETAKKASGEN